MACQPQALRAGSVEADGKRGVKGEEEGEEGEAGVVAGIKTDEVRGVSPLLEIAGLSLMTPDASRLLCSDLSQLPTQSLLATRQHRLSLLRLWLSRPVD